MFDVPQRRVKVRPHKDRGARLVFLRKEGKTMDEIARDSDIISMSGGYVLSRERVRQLLERENKKSTV